MKIPRCDIDRSDRNFKAHRQKIHVETNRVKEQQQQRV